MGNDQWPLCLKEINRLEEESRCVIEKLEAERNGSPEEEAYYRMMTLSLRKNGLPAIPEKEWMKEEGLAYISAEGEAADIEGLLRQMEDEFRGYGNALACMKCMRSFIQTYYGYIVLGIGADGTGSPFLSFLRWLKKTGLRKGLLYEEMHHELEAGLGEKMLEELICFMEGGQEMGSFRDLAPLSRFLDIFLHEDYPLLYDMRRDLGSILLILLGGEIFYDCGLEDGMGFGIRYYKIPSGNAVMNAIPDSPALGWAMENLFWHREAVKEICMDSLNCFRQMEDGSILVSSVVPISMSMIDSPRNIYAKAILADALRKAQTEAAGEEKAMNPPQAI